jgi:hypothetical protein
VVSHAASTPKARTELPQASGFAVACSFAGIFYGFFFRHKTSPVRSATDASIEEDN